MMELFDGAELICILQVVELWLSVGQSLLDQKNQLKRRKYRLLISYKEINGLLVGTLDVH